jgi:penicillin-binding protein 1A
VRQPITPEMRKQRQQRLLSIDSWIDTALFTIGDRTSRAAAAYAGYLLRFRTRGVARLLTEGSGEILTLGTAGLVVALAFAQPAFIETGGDWMTNSDFSITLLDRHGAEIGRRGILLDDAVPLEDFPDNLVKATLATEDRRFFSHFGIDFQGTFRALVANLRANSVVQGGSSITQQLAKNLFLSNERTLERKIKEAFLAIFLEANLTKREILKLYLDRAYLGGGTFGVTAASQFYFRRPVRDISLAQSAMLAGLYKAPAKYAPHIDLPAARARANIVLTDMVEAGFLTEGQVIGARRNPAQVVDNSDVYSPDYFLDYVYNQARKLVVGEQKVLRVHTTLDLDLQRQAETSVETHLRQHGAQYRVTQAAMVVLEPGGALRAMVGGRDYGDSQFNRATDALRQPGSSFKTFVYMTALMNGYKPNSIVRDAPITIRGWSPRNYIRGFAGPVTLTTGLTRSINTVAVRLGAQVGRRKVAKTASSMGINTKLIVTPSLPLGTSEVTILEMAGAYATLANGGVKSRPYAILEITAPDGRVLYMRDQISARSNQVLPPKKVHQINRMLENVVVAGTGRRAALEGIVAAGKTGTTQAYRDAWFIGYTGNYVAAVWYGNDNFSPTRRLTGGRLPAMTWQHFMQYAHANVDLKTIPGIAPAKAPRLPGARVASRRPNGTGSRRQTFRSAPRALLSRTTRGVLVEIEATFLRAQPLHRQ